MDITSIANFYTSASSYSLQMSVSTAMVDKAMDAAATEATALLEGFEATGAAVGNVGRNIDVYA